jgi:hypothetical protein
MLLLLLLYRIKCRKLVIHAIAIAGSMNNMYRIIRGESLFWSNIMAKQTWKTSINNANRILIQPYNIIIMDKYIIIYSIELFSLLLYTNQ